MLIWMLRTALLWPKHCNCLIVWHVNEISSFIWRDQFTTNNIAHQPYRTLYSRLQWHIILILMGFFQLQLQKCLFDTNHSKIQTGNIQQITLEKKNYQYIFMTTKEQSVRRPLLRSSNRLRKGHVEGVSCHQNCQYSQSWIKESFSMWWLRA